MATFEQIVSNSTLDVLVPTTGLGFPSEDIATDKWLAQLQSGETVERKLAFFDEHLEFLLLLRLEPPSNDSLSDPSQPPLTLLSFLTHLQVSYDASYIAPVPVTPAVASQNSLLPSARLGTPPRSSSLKPRGHVPPSIFPPSTPVPTPATAEQDRRYVKAEGTNLASGIWGEAKDAKGQGRDERQENRETFALLWDAEDKKWVAVYRMCVNVAFLRLNVSDPLLCLTVSTTLREKPVQVTPARKPLAALIAAAGGFPAEPTTGLGLGDGDDDQRRPNGLDEVNLLEGLMADPTFAINNSSPLTLPSTRLGPKTRRTEFSLGAPAPPETPNSALLVTPTTATHPTLRKSFRKTLNTVSGFRVRMRTVFVPYVLLPQDSVTASSPNEDAPRSAGLAVSPTAEDDELDELEAGHTERTVVLCIELENSGESGLGFAVEDVVVRVGGEGARVRLVWWGAEAAQRKGKVFPLRMSGMEQYNLLYAVEFLTAPVPEKEALVFGSGPAGGQELQRAVAINVHGRPYELIQHEDQDEPEYVYPTQVFSSRWNCVLDLAPPPRNVATPRVARNSLVPTQSSSPAGSRSAGEALPEPPSPFPTAATPQTAASFHPGVAPKPAESGPVAGSKRYTMPARTRPRTSLLNPASAGVRERDSLPAAPSPLSRLAYVPPSVAVQAYARTPTTPLTTFGPPSPLLTASFPPSISGGSGSGSGMGSGIPPPAPLSPHLPTSEMDEAFGMGMPPPTPAYPAYGPSSPVPPTPRAQGPLAGWGGSVGPTVDIPRSRMPGTPGMGSGSASLGSAGLGSPGLGTSGPLVGGEEIEPDGEVGGEEGKKVVVSVGLLPPPQMGAKKGLAVVGQPRIYPHDQFTLDIFVFNQSAWTRRFEVSCPERRRRRQQQGKGERVKGPGFVPLENRVRVGPLRPATCQSVRMDFLALTPGLHTIDTLTLTDVETGFSMNLRSVMDIVVHETHER